MVNLNEDEKREIKKERQRLAQQRYRLKHPEKEKEYRLNNPEKEKNRHKKYQGENKEKISKRTKEWRLRTLPIRKEKSREYYQQNLEKIRIKTTLRNKNNREQLKFYKAKNRYGITLRQYFTFLHNQDMKCALCLCDLRPWEKNTNIDHDNNTKVVRGLLCGSCNRGIGLLKHNTAILERAIAYLKK